MPTEDRDMSDPLNAELRPLVSNAKVLVVGAGGIGCELLKNLVLVGFGNIDLVDLDTIDVSNLNRQFLFQKQHVKRSKAEVAAEAVRKFNPNVNVNHFYDSIMAPDYNVSFFKQYTLVLNALDNKAARNHVNRLCLAADVPLVESGSAGYLGQVSVIKKGEFECYECEPKPSQKTYPGCTIRNTPSEPIHCIVWAKHLFNQLFGEADIDEDVSPDMADPELANGDQQSESADTPVSNGAVAEEEATQKTAVDARVSTRKWAADNNYEPVVLFNKMFRDDIEYLLSMGNLWKKRRAPTSLNWDDLPKEHAGSSTKSDETNGSSEMPTIRDQSVWTPHECREVFERTVLAFRDRLKQNEGTDQILVWDKDDDEACDFATACANLRAFIFGIGLKSRFDVKSMAGNIIPAIATTNAVVAGMIVMEALKIVNGEFEKSRTMFISRLPNPRGKILVDQMPNKPNPKCYVCSLKPEITVKLNTTTWTVGQLEERFLKTTLNMVAPDVQLADASGTIIISSEQGETDEIAKKFLHDVNVRDGSVLQCDDFMQQFELRLIILHTDEDLRDSGDFQLMTDTASLPVAKAEATTTVEEGEQKKKERNGEEAVTSTTVDLDDDEEEIMEVQPSSLVDIASAKASAKRKMPSDPIETNEAETKRHKPSN